MNAYEHVVKGRTAHIGIANGRPGSVAKCLQMDSEMVWLAPFIHKLEPRTIVEIGIYKGGWQYVLCPWFADGAHIIGIDAMIRHRQDDGADQLDSMAHRLRADGYRVDILKGRSDSNDVQLALKALLAEHGGEYDLLHIDGAHDYGSARYDWDTYSPCVREGGLTVLHDIGTQTSQMNVKRLWDEIKAEGVYVTHEVYEKNGIGVVEM